MPKNFFYIIGIIILITVAGSFLINVNSQETDINPQVVQGELQKVVLSQEGVNYKDVVIESGKPVLISADNSVAGCLRSVSFNIDGKKYSKYLRTAEDILELPALKKGTFTFSCSMGMGYGKLIVN